MEGFKYIQVSNGKHELYDLNKDPRELKNLFETMPEKAKQMQAYLENQLSAVEPVVTKKELPVIDRETEENLKALGYIR